MPQLYIPEMAPVSPPQVSPAARKEISLLLEREGAEETIRIGAQLLRSRHQLLSEYIAKLSTEVTPATATVTLGLTGVGASLAVLAYHETGFSTEIDESAIATGSLLTELGGIPDTFLESLAADSGIADLSTELLEVQQVRDPMHACARLIDVGAGCARFYLQQALIAA